MTANRDELIHLIEGLPDDQVDALRADARRRAAKKPKGTRPRNSWACSKTRLFVLDGERVVVS